MLRQHARLVDASLRLVDLVVFTATLPVAHFLRIRILDESHGDFLIQKYFPLLATVLLVWMAATRMFELYGVYRTQPLTRELWRLAKSAAVAGAAAGASGFLWRDHSIPRGLLGLYIGIAFLALVLVRLLVRRLAHAARRRGFNARMFAVVGAGDLAEDVVERFGSHPEWGYSFAGYILDDDAPPREDGAPVLGRLGQLGCLLESHVLDEVVFAVPGERVSRIQESARLCEEQGIEARICVDVQTGGIARISFGDIAGLPVLSFSSGPGDELALAAKRAFDVAASAAVLLLLAPLLAAVAVAIWLGSPGPILFRQRRVGLNGREFWLYKFRSMHQDAEARLQELRAHNEASGPVFKMRNDPRVTRIGRFIRKTSLDEFPQFWNVLRGEMSIVGPRPPLPAEVRQYKRWQRRRLSVKPGITCEWQVSGRSNVDFDRWMELDLHYIDNWSLWNDIRICARTIPAVFLTRGAH
jgi:exopolysaccharide biosynthesis polyprenyl glycosylphosphotransferase